MITLEQQIACARREVAMRRNVYPKWVKSGRMKQEQADHEIAVMDAIVFTLRQLEQQREGAKSPTPPTGGSHG